MGTDKDSMSNFFNYCNEIRQKGGVFSHGVCDVTLKLTNFILQTPTQKKYSEFYGKHLYFLDMTHDCTKYKLRLCPPAVVCGLGMTTIIGCGLCPGEDCEKIDWILVTFNLNSPNAIVCTDRGPG